VIKTESGGSVSNEVLSLIQQARDFRVKQERLWMEIDYMIDGNHSVFYDRTNDRLRVVPVKSNAIRRTINLIRVQDRNVSNFITKNDPAFNVDIVYAKTPTEEEEEKAEKKSNAFQALLLQVYRKLEMKYLFKQAVRIGMRRGKSYIQVIWDPAMDEVGAYVLDPFDVLEDPLNGGDIEKGRFVYKECMVSLEALKANPRYKNLDSLSSDNRFSSSEFRNSYMSSKYSIPTDTDHVLLGEFWQKNERVVEIAEEEMMEDGTMGVKRRKERKTFLKCTSLVKNTVICEEEWEYPRYPFKVYYPEDNMGEVYPRPWLADCLSLNKAIDANYSFIEQYIATCAQGRYIINEKSKITSRVTGDHGQVVSWSGAMPPQPWSPPPLPYQVIANQIAMTERFMNQIGGIQGIDIQQALTSNSSGAALSQLQAQQAESVGEPTTNLSRLAENVFNEFLCLMTHNYTESRDIRVTEKDKVEVVKMRGMGGVSDLFSKEQLEEAGELVLDAEEIQLRIEIVPGSAFSDLFAQQRIMELYDKELVDKETVLETMKIGRVREILDAKEEEEEKEQVKQVNAQRMGAMVNEESMLREAKNVADLSEAEEPTV
jgi:hypothetical protein